MMRREHLTTVPGNGRLRASLPIAITLVAAWLALPATSHAQYSGVPANGVMSKGGQPAGIAPADLAKIAFDQKLDARLPLDLPFRDETGRAVRLGDYFGHGRPVILTLIYFDCPLLCPRVIDGVAGAMKGMSLEPGRDYDLLTVSFNPRDTRSGAIVKKKQAIEWYGHPEASSSWHFLTGDQAAIELLTRTVGFHYVYSASTGQYAHPTGLMVATPDGRIAKYLFGIEFSPRDLRLALVTASEGRIGTPVDRILLYCYHYDPAAGKYGLVVMNTIRLGGVVTVVLLGSFITLTLRRERRKKKHEQQSAATGHPAGNETPRASN
jgi:protein SCO1/2